jgi:hypothetical protein
MQRESSILKAVDYVTDSGNSSDIGESLYDRIVMGDQQF